MCGHTHTMQGSYTSNTTYVMIDHTLGIITDRILGTQNPALAVPVAPESVNPAPEKLARLHNHSYKPRPLLYSAAGGDSLVVVM